MNIENTKAQMRKGLLELLVLAVLRKEEEAYVNVILEKLKEKEELQEKLLKQLKENIKKWEKCQYFQKI